MSPLSIAIIGAGPGGTLLARLLSLSPTPVHVTVFESETSLSTRSQGGTLDLRGGSGLTAIHEAGLWNDFRKHARWSGEALKVLDKRGTTWLSRPGGTEKGVGRDGGAAPEIDRVVLREMLAGSVPEGVIRWGKKVLSVEEEEGGWAMRFEDGSVESGFDLVVGADGAWSKVRKAVSDVVPYYSGVGGHEFGIGNAEKRAPDVWKLANGGSVFAFSDSKDLVIQVLGDGGLHVSAWTVRSENWMRDSGYDVHDLEQAKEAEKKEFADWVPELTSALDSVDPGVASRNLYMLPTDFTWKHKRGVTLLGDAAHLMTPFAGIGANLAMQDALELSYAIIAAAKDTEKPSKTGALDEHIKKYEKKLFPRMHTAQEVSASSMQYIFFTEGFPRSAIQKWCATVATHDMPLLMRPLVTVALYVYFFFFRMLV